MSESLLQCPLPAAPGDRLLLAHGEGARLTRRLIRELILPILDNPCLRRLADAASLPALTGTPVLAADCFVVSPLFFPGGDIGCLAVHGAVNDVAMAGGVPHSLTLGLILEEGLPLETLQRVLRSVRAAADACGVQVVAGDTKVVPRGAADQMFLAVAALGTRPPQLDLGCHRIQPGDRLLVSGAIGDHGLAILAAREGLDFDPPLASDSVPLLGLAQALLNANLDIHFLRDPTRGGVAGVAHEIVEATGLSVRLDEATIPVSPAVRGASELLGLDPLFVANEGKLVAVVPANQAEAALSVLREQPLGRQAALIGETLQEEPAAAWVKGLLGGAHMLDEPAGAPLPRIC